MLTRPEIETTLRAAGLAAGDKLLVHSSLRRVGPIVGGADTMIDAMLAVLGAQGTLAMPAFCYTWPLPDPWFDPATTPGRTGMLTEVFRKRPGVKRSLHPTHSLCATGARADEFVADHLSGKALGPGSPIDRLAEAGGYVLLIGVTHTSNTTIHVGEEHAGVRKFVFGPDGPPVARVRLPDGRILSHKLDDSTSCAQGFDAIDPVLREKNLVTDLTLGNAPCMLMKGQALIDTAVQMIRRQPDALFCTREECARCQRGREAVKSQEL
jgi:aminoglycoside 3-N-acetyltransferase